MRKTQDAPSSSELCTECNRELREKICNNEFKHYNDAIFKSFSKRCRHNMVFFVSDTSRRKDSIPEKWKPADKPIRNETPNASLISHFKWFLILLSVLLCIWWYKREAETAGNTNLKSVKILKENYPSQKNDTWFHILSILDQEIPSVKSITFLYATDRKTCNCLMRDLVFLFSKNKKLKMEDVTFASFGHEATDYGTMLQHYHPIVKTFGVLVTDVNKVSGRVARMFHTLCDEVSSDIKPSLYIFIVKDDTNNNTAEQVKPIERATALLRQAWGNDMSENEFSPLLSRVIKNVVEVMPEKQMNC